MHYVEVVLIALSILVGATSFFVILWTRRLAHVAPKFGEIKVVNPVGAITGFVEVMTQSKLIANRPWAGIAHFFLFYGFLVFSIKTTAHFIGGLLGMYVDFSDMLGVTGQVVEWSLDVSAVVVLAAVVFFGIRRWTSMKDRLTHHAESTLVLGYIGGLMVTYLAEHFTGTSGVAYKINWWIHSLLIVTFPSLIAYGKHLHLVVGPPHVMMKHMVEVPGDRFVNGADFDASLMEIEPETEEEEEELDRKMEAEVARLSMPNGVLDMGVHALLDPAACIECGRCNDACPSGPTLKPRDHFVLSMRDKSLDLEKLKEIIDPDTLATCTQCRACDNVCPVGNRPSLTALELRGRYHFEGEYPPIPMKEGGGNPVSATGNIFGQDPDDRAAFLEKNDIPIYDPEEHELLLILGCQGSYSPDAQPAVVATARLLEAAGIKYGVLEDEQCWGEGLLHGGGMMEDWPFYYQDRIEFLTESLGGDASRPMLTVCPHCRDTIQTQYGEFGGGFTNVQSHVAYLQELVAKGAIKLKPMSEPMAVHHPCKIIHHDEHGDMSALLRTAGVQERLAGNSPQTPSCCGGGGGGFLWDAPTKVNKKRWTELTTETGLHKVVTACSGCHRMLAVAKESEDDVIVDIAEVLHERLVTPTE